MEFIVAKQFISQKEIDEKRAEGKLPAENVPYDGRPLYEQLAEKQALAEEKWRESTKSKPPRALADDEVQYLNEEREKELEAERERQRRDQEEIAMFFKEQGSAQAESKPAEAKPQDPSPPPVLRTTRLPSKRKRGIAGLKTVNVAARGEGGANAVGKPSDEHQSKRQKMQANESAPPPKKAAEGASGASGAGAGLLGLAAYSSDSDSE